ncbi:MAG TPA: PEGA domain-containing protein [Vicinamibacterales bacterium]|nr:PEGA domain-containing protein [Vicinamibacterales bacterium]
MLGPRRVLTLLSLAAVTVIAVPSQGHAQAARVAVPAHRVVVYGGFGGGFYRPWFYDPWFGPWYGYGWGGGYYPWGPYPYGYPYPYRYYVDSSVRLDVKPKEAEVYVDDYYAGIVDNFDGVFQRLHLPPGDHDLVLYMDGYKAVHQHVHLTPDNTLKLKYNMEKLAPGEQPEPRPQPPAQPPNSANTGRPGGPPAGYPYPPPPGRVPPGRMPVPPGGQGPQGSGQPGARSGGATVQAAAYGTITVRVQPSDAEVLIDGQPWRGAQGQDQLRVDVAEGSHTIEIRKPGYRTYVTDVQVKPGESTPLNVSLRSQDQL